MNARLTALGLALALTLGITPALAAESAAENAPLPSFTDVLPDGTGDTWYDYESIQICAEAGILQGSGDLFDPCGTLTVGETAVIAARFYAQTTGEPPAEPAHGEEWYEPAMAVMEETEAIYFMGDSPMSVDPLAPITREGFVHAVASGVPIGYMPVLSHFSVLPDTDNMIVLLFYNAGLLSGVDKYGTFDGDKTLTRAEAAVILARILEPERRKVFTPAISEDEMLSLLFAKALTEHPTRYVTPDDIFSSQLSLEELEQALSLAGFSADEVLLRIGGVTVAAEQYLPLLILEIRQTPDIEGASFLSAPYPLLIDDVSYSPSDAAKRMAANRCVDELLHRFVSKDWPTEEERAAYLTEHPLSESEVLKNLDVPQFYEAFLSAAEK